MTTPVYYVYEPQYVSRSWPDDAGITPISWFDRNLAEPTGGPSRLINQNLFFAPSVEYDATTQKLVNTSMFFSPTAATLDASDEAPLRNEIRRRRILKREEE